MKKMIQNRNNIILALIICIVFMGIGFIILSIRLKHFHDEVHSLDVSFVDIKKSSSVMGSTMEPIGEAEILSQKKEIQFHFTMYSVHDEIVYLATIKNHGTLPAEIVDVISSPDYQNERFEKLISPVSVTISDITGKIIPPGDEVTLKINVYYNPSQSGGKKSFDYKIGLITKSRT